MPPRERPSQVLGSLPSSRPHRRSAKRAPKQSAEPQAPAAPKPRGAAPKASGAAAPKPRSAAPRPKAPAATPRRAPAPALARPPARTEAPGGREILLTAVQAAAELAEIGLSVSARAMRGTISRLPRP